MKHKRCDRVAESIHETISVLLSRGLNDPRIGFVTITAVDVSEDLHLAKIHYTVIGDEAAKTSTSAGLESAKGFLRREIGRALTLRSVPEIAFFYDHSQEYGNRIDSILREIGQEHDGDNPEDR